MMMLFSICIVAVVAIWAYEYRRLSTNPDLNCLGSISCPLRYHLGKWKSIGTNVFTDRARRENDTLTADGRMEHISYPVPDPSGTRSDLFT